MMGPPRASRKRKQDASGSCSVTKSPYFSSTNTTDSIKSSSTQGATRLPASFFDQPCEDLAKALLGQRLIHLLSTGERLTGDIVETEAYMGKEDSACHSYKGHRTSRNEAMYQSPGTCYVYLIYGMYDCLNISSRGGGQAVLIRALEPKEGIPLMQKFRSKRRKNAAKDLKTKDLCSGPGKLTEALQITKAEMNQVSLATSSSLWMEKGERQIEAADIVACPRIGVDYATAEWVKKPLRFYIRGDSCVSKRDKGAEG